MGIQGKENADALTKLAALNPLEEIPHYIKKTLSNLKRTLKEKAKKQTKFKSD